jgi:cytoskeletal protein RodZ
MRFGFLTLALILTVFASAMPIALVKAQQPRNQSQSQEGLSPGQKKTLSKYGPEEIFGVGGDESRSRGAVQGSRQQRRGTPTPTPSSPPQRQSTTSAAAQPAATQPPVTSAQQPAVATPTATIPAPTLAAGLQQSPLNQEDSPGKIDSKWAAPILILMALIVSGALIFTLTKLFEKIREGSSG